MISADFEHLADEGMPPEELAEVFLSAYFSGQRPRYPLNPFQMLRDMGVSFAFRPFKSYEGVYLPAKSDEDIPVVGINLGRPIARQRFTAAHELCHHLKDCHRTIACEIDSRSPIERYAERFAAGLLMPEDEVRRQIATRSPGGSLGLPDVLFIADYFGVSFQACLNRLAYDFHVIDGDISPKSLKKRRASFRPDAKRRELGLDDTNLFEQIFDAAGNCLEVQLTPRARLAFEAEYVFHDSRMEGVVISREKASEIVVDLQSKGNRSPFCNEENRNIVEVAGLSKAYDFVFERGSTAANVDIYDAKKINELLFSTAPHPDVAGRYRESNTLVIGAKFETTDYRRIPQEMHLLDREVQSLLDFADSLPLSEYIERALDIHHQMTRIHPFRDGNGRTSRAFTNLLFVIRKLPPVLFSGNEKAAYKRALGKADEGSMSDLYRVYFRGMLDSHSRIFGIPLDA